MQMHQFHSLSSERFLCCRKSLRVWKRSRWSRPRARSLTFSWRSPITGSSSALVRVVCLSGHFLESSVDNLMDKTLCFSCRSSSAERRFSGRSSWHVVPDCPTHARLPVQTLPLHRRERSRLMTPNHNVCLSLTFFCGTLKLLTVLIRAVRVFSKMYFFYENI